MQKNGIVREPVQDRSIEKKQKIIQAGEEIFARKGYERSNSKEIAREAGVSIGSFYAYFKDKGALFQDIIEGYYEEIFSRTRQLMEAEVLRGNESRKIIEKVIQSLYDAHSIKPALHREISIILLRGENSEKNPNSNLYRTVLEKVKILDHKVLEWLKAILRQWLPELDDDRISIAAGLMFRVCEETIHRLRQFPDPLEPPDRILNELIEMIEAYLKQLRTTNQ